MSAKRNPIRTACWAWAGALWLGVAVLSAGEPKESKMDPKWTYHYEPTGNAMNMGLYDAALGADGSVFLLLYGDQAHSRLLKVDSAGKQAFCADLSFGAYSMAVGEAGIYAVGYHYRRSPKDSASITTPDVALVGPEGKEVWHVVPPPPVQVQQDGKRESVWDLTPVGACDYYVVRAVPGGCLVLGVAQIDEGPIMLLVKLNADGTVAWQKHIRAGADWAYMYPNKVEPHVEIIGDRALIAGAFQTPGAAQVFVAWVSLKDGAIEKSFAPAGDHRYAAISYNQEAQRIAVACIKSVFILDANLAEVASFPTNGLFTDAIQWDGEKGMRMTGFVHGESVFFRLPTLVRLDDQGKEVMRRVFRDEWLNDGMGLLPIPGGCYVAYARILSKRPAIVDRTEMVIRRMTGDRSEVFRFAPTKTVFGNAMLLPGKDGVIVVFDQGGREVWAMGF